MTKRQIALVACAVAAATTGLGAAPPTAPEAASASRTVHRVKPGESIQKAVDAARPGTASSSPRHLPRERHHHHPAPDPAGLVRLPTVIVPGKAASGACAVAGHGVCVTGTAQRPVEGVTVRTLTLRNFARNGLWASRTDRLTVRGVTAEKNGNWGIAQERSVRSVLSHNTARDNGDAGLFVSNTTDTEEGPSTPGARRSATTVCPATASASPCGGCGT